MPLNQTTNSFFDRLSTIFNSSVLIRGKSVDQIKVLDVNKLQANTSLETNRASTNYSSVYQYNSYSQGYYDNAGYFTLKNELYRDYDAMDSDAIIGSACDLFAEDSLTENEYGEVLQITSDNENIKESLTNLFYDILNVEFNLWSWVRNLCKYGNFYLKLDITEKVGITNVIPLSAYAVERIEDPTNPENVRFRYDKTIGMYNVRGANVKSDGFDLLNNYEVIHFRLLSDTNFLPYGRSIFEPARKTWKQLVLLEDAMMIHRIMRAPDKRVYKIDIGNIDPTDVDSYMNKIMSQLKKVPYMDEQTGQYNLKFNMDNVTEDIFLPVRGTNSGNEVDTLGGLTYTAIDDIEYIRDKLFAALRIPKSFLSYDDMLQGKNTLSGEDIRFSRTIQRIQMMVLSELNKIALIHLYSQGYDDDDLTNFDLSLTTSSKAAELEQLELLSEKLSIAESAKESNLLSLNWIYANIFNFSEDEIQEEERQIIKDSKTAYRHTMIADEGEDPYKQTEKITDTEKDDLSLEQLINSPEKLRLK